MYMCANGVRVSKTVLMAVRCSREINWTALREKLCIHLFNNSGTVGEVYDLPIVEEREFSIRVKNL